MDLAAPRFAGVDVLLGSGGGDFASAVTYAVDTLATDLDQDGLADVAVTRWAQDNVVVLAGVGGGRFGPPVDAGDTENGPVTIAARDLDADDDIDLAVGCYSVRPCRASGHRCSPLPYHLRR